MDRTIPWIELRLLERDTRKFTYQGSHWPTNPYVVRTSNRVIIYQGLSSRVAGSVGQHEKGACMSFGLRMPCIISYLRRKILIRSSGYLPRLRGMHVRTPDIFFLSFFNSGTYVTSYAESFFLFLFLFLLPLNSTDQRMCRRPLTEMSGRRGEAWRGATTRLQYIVTGVVRAPFLGPRQLV